MRFNLPEAASHYARLAAMFGLHAHQMSEAEAAARAPDEVERFLDRLGFVRGLRNHGVPRESLPALAREAFQDPCHRTNIKACTEADLWRLYEESW